MSEQNLYEILCKYHGVAGWSVPSVHPEDEGVWKGWDWKEAIYNFLENWNEGWYESYRPRIVNPSEDGRSGTMEIHEEYPLESGDLTYVKATIIEDE